METWSFSETVVITFRVLIADISAEKTGAECFHLNVGAKLPIFINFEQNSGSRL